MCYSYRDREAREEAQARIARQKEERERREQGPKEQNDKRAPERERDLVKA